MSRNKAHTYEGPWCPRRLPLLQSPAWRNCPRPLKALLEELEIEHLRHRGCQNGMLFRSYSQFIAAGMNRNTVSSMIKLGEALGLLKVTRDTGVRRANSELRDACAYTLTYLATGEASDIAPSDDWKRIKTDEQALAIVERNGKTKNENNGRPLRRVAR